MTQNNTQPLLPDTILSIYCLKGDLGGIEISADGFLGNWEDDGYCFLFFRQPADDDIDRLLVENKVLTLEDTFTMSYRDWQGGFINPVRIGRFVLNPPWLKRVAEDDEIGLTFDPGLVFGNGTHPTTLACLTGVEIACAGGNVERMVDLGTGAWLGCREVIAVDNNMLAVSTAANNISLNGLEQHILPVNGLAQTFTALPSDLMVANIGYRVLDEILTGENLHNHCWLVLSGLQNNEAKTILRILAQLDVVVLKHWQSEAIWNTILAITQSGR